MRRTAQTRVTVVATACLVALLVGFLLLRFSSSRKSQAAQSRTLNEWLIELEAEPGWYARPVFWVWRGAAVGDTNFNRQLGGAVPVEGRTPRAALRRFQLECARWSLDRDSQVFFRHIAAVNALSRLGTNAWPAIPRLLDRVALGQHEALAVLCNMRANMAPGFPELVRERASTPKAVGLSIWMVTLTDSSGVSRDQDHRQFGVECLGLLGSAAKPAVSLLNSLLADPDQDMRRKSVESLGLIGAGAASTVPALKGILHNSEEWADIRAAAILALLRIAPSDPELIPAFREALHDPWVLVRIQAAAALCRLQESPGDSIAVLTNALSHKLGSVRAAARRSLADLGIPEPPEKSRSGP